MRANHFSGHIFCPLSLNNGTNDLLNLNVSSTNFAGEHLVYNKQLKTPEKEKSDQQHPNAQIYEK